jgi:hypothetical protein
MHPKHPFDFHGLPLNAQYPHLKIITQFKGLPEYVEICGFAGAHNIERPQRNEPRKTKASVLPACVKQESSGAVEYSLDLDAWYVERGLRRLSARELGRFSDVLPEIGAVYKSEVYSPKEGWQPITRQVGMYR